MISKSGAAGAVALLLFSFGPDWIKVLIYVGCIINSLIQALAHLNDENIEDKSNPSTFQCIADYLVCFQINVLALPVIEVMYMIQLIRYITVSNC